jgi:hypothetical protein
MHAVLHGLWLCFYAPYWWRITKATPWNMSSLLGEDSVPTGAQSGRDFNQFYDL